MVTFYNYTTEMHQKVSDSHPKCPSATTCCPYMVMYITAHCHTLTYILVCIKLTKAELEMWSTFTYKILQPSFSFN